MDTPTHPLDTIEIRDADSDASDDVGSMPGATEVSASRPRTRWAGIIWGLALAASATLGLWVMSSTERRGAAAVWVTTLSPTAIIAYALLAVGILVLITGAIGLLRRAQVLVASRR